MAETPLHTAAITTLDVLTMKYRVLVRKLRLFKRIMDKDTASLSAWVCGDGSLQ